MTNSIYPSLTPAKPREAGTNIAPFFGWLAVYVVCGSVLFACGFTWGLLRNERLAAAAERQADALDRIAAAMERPVAVAQKGKR